eukprot:TRINITY_DN34841_c0_g4_i2.p1 TRINITY_DN34841_c0_g4~~TRINITY_DN34841_c0_g4_i2.p1  ORF type:complete len:1263 (+),score=178.29 TRINITY_DN34841_c0_g4_i2:133-3921(+)
MVEKPQGGRDIRSSRMSVESRRTSCDSADSQPSAKSSEGFSESEHDVDPVSPGLLSVGGRSGASPRRPSLMSSTMDSFASRFRRKSEVTVCDEVPSLASRILRSPMRVSSKNANRHLKYKVHVTPGGKGVEDEVTLEDSKGQMHALAPGVVSWLNGRNRQTLNGCLAFVPWILQQASAEGRLVIDQPICHHGDGAVVSVGVHGFTSLTDQLAKSARGADQLEQCLSAFLKPLIDLILSYRGDIIKFFGNALKVYIPAVDDTGSTVRSRMPPHGSHGLEDLGPMATAVLRAAACCSEVQKRMNNFETGVQGLKLTLRIGVGCGHVTIVQIGGEVPPETHVPRYEFMMAGPPLAQLSIAEQLAQDGETCFSSQAWEHVKDCVLEDFGRKLEDRPDYHLLLKLDETKYTFPTVKHAAMLRDRRAEVQFQLSELNILRRFMPSAVFKQLECGTLKYVNEIRSFSIVMIGVYGMDASTTVGARSLQELMRMVQKACYAHEGSLNKFTIDDSGMVFLLAFGLPPLVHTDDATRAVLASLDMLESFRRKNLFSRIGVTTGQAYCGVCGSGQRMEYAVMGKTVNTAADLMTNAARNGILVDEATKNKLTTEVVCAELPPLTLSGRSTPFAVYEPCRGPPPLHMGVGPRGELYLPWYRLPLGGMSPQIGERCKKTEQNVFKRNMLHLVGLPDWEGLKALGQVMGGSSSLATHGDAAKPSTVPPPVQVLQRDKDAWSLGPTERLDAGVIVLEGKTGMGKIELAEHAVVYAAHERRALPICGSMGPRTDDPERIGIELLRSCIAIYQYLDEGLPGEEYQALVRICPSSLTSTLHQIREAFRGNVPAEQREALLDTLLRVTIALIQGLRERTALLLVLQLENGTNLFEKTKQAFLPFWSVVHALASLTSSPLDVNGADFIRNTSGVTGSDECQTNERPPSPTSPTSPTSGRTTGLRRLETPSAKSVTTLTTQQSENKGLPVSILCLVGVADEGNAVVAKAENQGHLVRLKELSEASSFEYMSRILGIPVAMLPGPVSDFIARVSQGNPLYIRETIQRLLELKHIVVHRDAAEQPERVEYSADLDKIDIARWSTTAMVGQLECLLESLDPMEAAVLKMSTAFKGIFTLPDLAASTCSQWAGSTYFDYLRLHRAIQNLVRRSLLAMVKDDMSEDRSESSSPTRALKAYKLQNVLIRKVAGSMLLEAQRKVVKRQALIDRVLSSDLPARLEAANREQHGGHIPWYYEDILLRPFDPRPTDVTRKSAARKSAAATGKG